jgi:putative salt-induced outer membrane protein YdiY
MRAQLAGLVLMMVLAGPVSGQDAKKAVSFTGDIGVVNTAGNTHLTTINLGDKLTVQAGKLLLTQTFAFVYGKSEGVQNANSQVARLRADYPLVSWLSGYVLAGYERNRFAGIDRRLDEGVGLAAGLLHSEKNELELEVGVGLVQQRLFPDPELPATVSDNFGSGRAASRFKHLFTKTAWFQQTLEFLPNLEHSSDYRINSETALVAALSAHLGLKASYLVKYNHLPPSPELARTDRFLTTSLQITY